VDFVARVRADLPRLDLLILNAGVSYMPGGAYTLDAAGEHEQILQVNVLSNALLLAELLPLPEADRGPAYVTWVGSYGM
jgi:NAD(P)-dependent dehydrogenase (short-subunit alcohol dehydrogenase family)